MANSRTPHLSSEDRRARVLDEARILFMEGGPEGVNMRDLADRAEVSVPTLYNMFGSKMDILAAVAKTVHVDAFERLRQTEGTQGLSRLFLLVDQISSEMEMAPVLTRSLMQLQITWRGESEHREFTALEFAELFEHCLKEMQQSGGLAMHANREMLTRQMAKQMLSIGSEWAFGRISLGEFSDDAKNTIALSLYGFATGDAHQEIEARLKGAGLLL